MVFSWKGDAHDFTRPHATPGPHEQPETRKEREEEQRRHREKGREERERKDGEQRERILEAREAGQNRDREQHDGQEQDRRGTRDAAIHVSAMNSRGSFDHDGTNASGGFLHLPSFDRRPTYPVTKGHVIPDASETDSSTYPGDVVPSLRLAGHQHSRGRSIDDQAPSSFHAPSGTGPGVRKAQYSEEDIFQTRLPSAELLKPSLRGTDPVSDPAAPSTSNRDATSHRVKNSPLVHLQSHNNMSEYTVQPPNLSRRGSSTSRPILAQEQPLFPKGFSEGLYQLHGYSSTSLQSMRGASRSPSRPGPQIWQPSSAQNNDVMPRKYLSPRLGRLGSALNSTTSITSTNPSGYYSSATDSSSERSDNEAARAGQGRPKVPNPPRIMPPASFKPLPPLPTSALQNENRSDPKASDSERRPSDRSANVPAIVSPHRPEEAQSSPPIITVQDYENLPSTSDSLMPRHQPAEIQASGDRPLADSNNKISLTNDASESTYRSSPSVRMNGPLEGPPRNLLDAGLKVLPRPPSTPNDGKNQPPQRSYAMATVGTVSRQTSNDVMTRSHGLLADRVSPSASHGEASSSDASSPASDQEVAKQKADVKGQETNTAGTGQTPPLPSPAPGNNVSSNSSRLILHKLSAIFDDKVLYRSLLSSEPSDAQMILDVFQMLLDTRELHDRRRRQLITAMQRLSAKTRLYPRRFNLNGPVRVFSDHPVTSGSYADIYRAYSQGEYLCLKVIKAYKPSLVEHMAKVYAKEAILWGQLSHPNVLPFYGLLPFHTQISFVSPWAENGHLGDYLEQNPRANRVLLCSDAAAGIAYLHANTIVHGDLKGANVLVDESGRACLADFGLSSVTDPQILHWATQSSVASRGGSIRWQAPELHVPAPTDTSEDKTVHNSKETDVFAWACLCYEIFTGHLPFFETRNEATVMLKVILGARPTRPPAATDAWVERGLKPHMWALMDDCWKFKPLERPDITSVLTRLQVEQPVDHRPPPQWRGKSAMRFRNFHEARVHDRGHRPSLKDLDSILSRVTRST